MQLLIMQGLLKRFLILRHSICTRHTVYLYRFFSVPRRHGQNKKARPVLPFGDVIAMVLGFTVDTNLDFT